MKRLKTVSIYAGLLLGHCISFVTAADVPQEAFDAWQEFHEKVSVGQVVTTHTNYRKEKVIAKNVKSLLLRNGQNVVSITGASSAKDNEMIIIRNKKGTFGLSKKTNDKTWLLSFAEPLGSEKGDGLLQLVATEMLFAIPIKVSSSNLAHMAKSSETEFSNWEVFLDTNGKQLARFHVVVRENDSEHRLNPGMEYKIVVDPANKFRVVSSEASDQTGSGVSQFYYEKALPHYFPEREVVTYFDKSGVKTGGARCNIQSITYDPPPDEVFELSHYGVEDVEFATKSPSYTWLYATCILLGVCSFGGYLWMRKRNG